MKSDSGNERPGRLLGPAGIYVVSNIANAAVPFLLLPVLTRFLEPESYGIVAMFQVLTGILVPLVGLNLHGAIARRFYQSSGRLPRYVATSLTLVTIASLAAALLLWLFRDAIEQFAAFPSDHLWAVWCFSVGQVMILVTLTLWQVRVRPLAYGSFTFLKTAADAALSLLFVVGLGWDWQGRILGQTLATAGLGAIGLLILMRRGDIRAMPEADMARHALAFGIPLVPHALGAWAIQMTDRVLLANLVGLETTGVYLAGLQISTILLVIQDAFNKAWVPYLFGHLANSTEGIHTRLVRITYGYCVAILAVALAMGALAPLVVPWLLGVAYDGASPFVLWLSLGFAANGMYKMVSSYIFYSERTPILAWVTALTAISNIAFTYLLIRANGPIGAAQGTALAWTVSFLVTWLLAARVHPMPWGQAVLGGRRTRGPS